MNSSFAESPLDAGAKSREFWICFCVIIALYSALTLPVIDVPQAGNDFDEATYHYPAVLLIRSHWPSLDLIRDCLSPIAPGYHYFLASCSLVAGESLLEVRLVNLAVSLFVPIALYWGLTNWVAPRQALLTTLPLLVCAGFLKGAVRVVTDDASLLLMLLTILSLFLLPARGRLGSLAGFAATAAVFVRQLNIYLAVPIFLQALLSQFRVVRDLPDCGDRKSPGFAADAISWGGRLLPLCLMGLLILRWHGLVPPAWRHVSVTLSAAPIDYALSVAGFLGAFFLFTLGKLNLAAWRDPWVQVAAGAGFAASLVSPSSYAPEIGRWGGWIWLLVKLSPTLAGRSVIFMLLAPVGAAVVCFLGRMVWLSGQRNAALIWTGAVLAWMGTFCVATNIYHHYYEAPLLIFLAIHSGLILRRRSEISLQPIGLFALIAYESLVSFVEVYLRVFLHHDPGAMLVLQGS